MAWEQKEISVTELNAEVAKLVELEKIYEEKKKIYREADAEYETQRAKLLNLLTEAGVDKYYAAGYGTISLALKRQASVPKNPADKKLMLEYFESLGPELFNAYVTVNSQTLNSYIKEQSNLDPNFTIPGIGEIKETPELRFRKN
jgi:hypothetical protein